MRGRGWVQVLGSVLRAFAGGRPRAGDAPRSAPLRPTPTARPTVPGRTASGRGPADAAPGRRSGGAPRTTSGDFTGRVRTEYSPDLDGGADPGEIVWTWVPFEDDPERGKDRPVLLVGRDGASLLGLMLSSKDHSRDAADEARWGRAWLDIGAGDWDSQRRPSEVRLDRVLRVDPAAVRREGAVMSRALFDRVTDSLAEHHGW